MRSPTPSLLTAGAVAALLLLPCSALAQQPTTPSRRPDVTALIERAKDALATDDKPEQLQSLRGLNALSPEPIVVCTLGQVERRLGQFPEAAEHLTRCIDDPPAGSTSTWLTNLRGEKAMARAEVGILTIAAPAGAMVFIDGEPRGTWHLGREYFLEPKSPHRIEVTFRGISRGSTVSLPRGTRGNIEFDFPLTPPLGDWVVFGGVIAAAASTLTGVVLYGVSVSKYDAAAFHQSEAEKVPQACYLPARSLHCDEFDSAANGAARLHNAAIGLWVGAGVLVAGTTIYHFAKPASASPRLTVGIFSVRLEGSW